MKKLQLLALLAVVLMAATALAVNHSPPAAANVNFLNNECITSSSDATINVGTIGIVPAFSAGANSNVFGTATAVSTTYATVPSAYTVQNNNTHATATRNDAVAASRRDERIRKGAERRFLLDVEKYALARTNFT